MLLSNWSRVSGPAQEKSLRGRSKINGPVNELLSKGTAMSVPCPLVSAFRLLNRPMGTRLDRGMSRLVHGTAVLEPPHFDLAEQRECRTLPQWVRLRNFEKALPECIRPAWRNRVDICFFSVWAMLQECVFDRPQKFVG